MSWLLIAGVAGCAAPPGGAARDEVDRPNASRLADEHFEQGQLFVDQGLLDAAVASFGLALEENPRMAAAYLEMGHIFREREEYVQASRAYERATFLAPDLFEGQYYLALMRQFLGQTQAAINGYLRALALNPGDARVNRDLASAYLQAGRPDAALRYARQATQLASESQEAWCNLGAAYSLLGRYEDAVDCYREAAELGELPPPVMLSLADTHLKLENFQRAANVLEALTARTPTAAAWERLGYARFRLKRFARAQEAYAQALAKDPSDVASLNGMGACLMTQYLQEGRVRFELRDQARRFWRRSLQVDPGQELIIDLLARYRTL